MRRKEFQVPSLGRTHEHVEYITCEALVDEETVGRTVVEAGISPPAHDVGQSTSSQQREQARWLKQLIRLQQGAWLQ